MVLGASGYESTETHNDDSLISRMFKYMLAGGAFPQGTSFDQAYPILKALITSNSARRQGVPEDELFGMLMQEMQANATPKTTCESPRMVGPAGMLETEASYDKFKKT